MVIIKMVCPNCGSLNIEITNHQTDGQGYYELETYNCNDCDCEWEWKMEKNITKKGKIQNE